MTRKDKKMLEKALRDAMADEPAEMVDKLVADALEQASRPDAEVKVVKTEADKIALGLKLLANAAPGYESKEDYTKDVAIEVAKLVTAREMDAAIASALIVGVATGQCLVLPLEDAREHNLTPRSFLAEGCVPAIRDDESFFEFLEQRDRDMLEVHFNLDSPEDIPDDEQL
jgi:hypothetical protein